MTIKERLRYAIAAYVAQPSPLNAAALNQVVEAVGVLEQDQQASAAATSPAALPAPTSAPQSAVDAAVDAIERAVDADWARTLSVLTGAFVGLAVAATRAQGHDADQEIRIDGGSARDITIHEKKGGG